MSTLLPRDFQTVTPSEADARLALESSRQLAARKFGKRASVGIRLGDDDAEPIVVPTSVVRMLAQLLAEMSQGHTVSLIPIESELSTQQAADLLNVSRPYVVKLLDEGKIPSRTVGKYRRVRLDDLLEFKRKDIESREKIMEELTALDQELGLGY